MLSAKVIGESYARPLTANLLLNDLAICKLYGDFFGDPKLKGRPERPEMLGHKILYEEKR